MEPVQISSRRRGHETAYPRGTTEGLVGGPPTSLSERLAQVASKRERRIPFTQGWRITLTILRGAGFFLAGIGVGTLIRDFVDRFL